jgi:hypothetical protein
MERIVDENDGSACHSGKSNPDFMTEAGYEL